MDFSALFMDAAAYTQGAFWGRWKDALALLVSLVLFPVFFGHITRILRGEEPAPPVEWSLRSCVDGIKLLVIWFVYTTPAFVAGILLFGYVAVVYEIEGVNAIEPVLPEIIGGFLVVFVVYLFTALMANLAGVRFARERRFFAAFSVRKIWGLIDRLGFWDYVIAVVLISAFMNAIVAVIALIPQDAVVFVLEVLAFIPLFIFQARYFSRIYDLATE
ncbi:MAG: DUF4013 domain-containing protein [Methanofollis sp.]|uniref:DUF4013 domain-containing protein n=1 Tax=Methanofollis sp. TaxID=2052835 RepID=UPI002624E49D|nr:DUF4013 domain-containing protein [Methanofollis sp.]MDD4254318.1 DUF4013 domain-containing protein [Methanofollis sp.]